MLKASFDSSRQTGLRLSLLMRGAAVLLWSAYLAGCASGPGGTGARSTTPVAKPATERPMPVARPGDRDGPPSDAPPDLAALPDPVPQVEPIKPGGPNKPYTVLGQTYEPQAADVRWKERGAASWYGTKFHGRRTASGELFSMYGLTAAHRTLPIPSYARVRHVASGKEVIVRINDRGPFHGGRVLDLSYAAATKLGFVGQGSAEVEIERLTFDEIRTGQWQRGTVMEMDPAVAEVSPVALPSSETVAPVAPRTSSLSRAYTAAAKGFWVQLAALGKRDGVERLQQRIAAELSTLQPLVAVFHEATLFKLQVGPYASRDQALAAAEQARATLQLAPLLIERR